MRALVDKYQISTTRIATEESAASNMDIHKLKHEGHQAMTRHSKQCSRWQRFRLAANDTFWEYAKKTKVSGMWLLREKRTQGTTRAARNRLIWTGVLLNLFLLGVFLSLQLWLKFYSYPILNTISNDLSITDVAFPGITICSPQVVNMDRVERYVQKLKIPVDYDPRKVVAGFEFINAFTDHNWTPPQQDAFNVTDAVLRLNNVSIYQAAVSVSAGCDDFVKRCFWGAVEFPCRQQHEYLSFKATNSFLGPCCSFNYNPRNLSYVPFSSNIFGVNGGLSFIGTEGSERNLSLGLIVLVHHPMDFVTEATASVTIATNSESFVEILPTVQTSSEKVLELSQRKRDCLISNDLELRSYRQAACVLTCQTEAISKKCNCFPYHLPTLSKKKECKLRDALCYSLYYDTFKSVKCERCLPNCYDVTYSTLAYKTDLLLHNYSVGMLHTSMNLTSDNFIVQIYMAKQAVPCIRKVTVMSWIGLLSDLGGVFNLCLGLSVISLVEFVYYCTYRLYVNYHMHSVLLQRQALK